MIRAVIVEDEPLAARYLQSLLDETGKVEVVGIARNGKLGLDLCVEKGGDAAFIDIHLPGADGLQLGAHLAMLARPPLIVFTTGDADHACEAFRIAAVDYLLKPLEPAQIIEAVRRIEARLQQRETAGEARTEPNPSSSIELLGDRLRVKNADNDVIKLLARWEIVVALRRDRRTWIHTAKEEFSTYYPLDDLLLWLREPPFLRLSREAIINLQAVEDVTHYGDRLYQVRLRDRKETRLEASRSGATRLAALLKTSL